MGNRRSHFVADREDIAPAKFVCLVDVGVTVAGCHVREGESFIADPREVAELESKGFIERQKFDTPFTPDPEPDPDIVITTESTE